VRAAYVIGQVFRGGPCLTLDAILPFKLNADRRHHIPKQTLPLAILTGLMLRAVFRLALRQTKG